MNFSHLFKDELTPNSHIHTSLKFLHNLQEEYRCEYDNSWPAFFECNFINVKSRFDVGLLNAQLIRIFPVIQEFYGKPKTVKVVVDALGVYIF